MANTCPDCGANLALVGLRHRCTGVKRDGSGHGSAADAGSIPATSTYQYRDEEDRRAYMRAYMRAYRAKGKSTVESS